MRVFLANIGLAIKIMEFQARIESMYQAISMKGHCMESINWKGYHFQRILFVTNIEKHILNTSAYCANISS